MPVAPVFIVASSAAALSPIADEAVTAFSKVCLAQRAAGIDATRTAIQRTPGVTSGEKLPPLLTGGAPMETYRAGGIEFLLRPGKGGAFGCFVAYKPTGDDAPAIVDALGARPELRQKPLRASKRVRYEWVFANGGKDGVYVTPDSQIGGMLLNLEVGRK